MNFKLVVTSLIATASAQTIADILSRDTTGVALIWDSIKTLPSSAMFSAKGNMTVFAPNNAAMTSLNGTYPTLYAAVTANPSDLDAIVKYHVIDAYLPVTADGVSILNTYSNMTSIWKNSAGKITVTGGIDRTATVIKYFEATNGIVYIVDTVLIPPLSLSITAQIMGWNGMTGVVEGAKLDGVLDTLKNKT